MNKKILKLLMTEGKMTHNEMAQRLHRSPSTIRDRISRLERENIIMGYVTLVDYGRIGMGVDAIIFANLDDDASVNELHHLSEIPGVLEVLQISGHRRIMIRLRASDGNSLQEIIEHELIPLGLKDLDLRLVLDSVMRFPGL
ncbi:MAG: Lrp/AsnC family transcriptional regulator [Methanomassiliicoccales archaeon]